MLTIDEYIAKLKKADKLDEFDITRQADNMSAILKYVMSYFNEYLTIEGCNTEELKMKHAVDTLDEEINRYLPLSKLFVVSFFLEHKIRIDKEVEKYISRIDYFDFTYSKEDFLSLATDFCLDYKVKGSDVKQYVDEVAVLIKEIKKKTTEKPNSSEYVHLDNNITSWVLDTYQQYGVNLFSFCSDHSYSYYQRYVKYERSRYGNEGYYVNNYDHRYNSNPFEVDQIIEANKDRPFLANRRGELEMVIMHDWLFSMVHDEEYWPEYVNLCVERGRVSVVRKVNALFAVSLNGLKYPDDVKCFTELYCTQDGILKPTPGGTYILRINNPDIWSRKESINLLVENLDKTFEQHGVARVVEIDAPNKSANFSEDVFLSFCSTLEKRLKKYNMLKLSIVNGQGNNRTKPNSYISSMDDFIKLRTQLRDRKIPIKFSIDFSLLCSAKRYPRIEGLELLHEIRNSVICIYVDNIFSSPKSSPRPKIIGDNNPSYYLQKFRYPEYDDFYTILSSSLYDNQKRYLIPRSIKNNINLETLVDNLLRSGFSFVTVTEGTK